MRPGLVPGLLLLVQGGGSTKLGTELNRRTGVAGGYAGVARFFEQEYRE